MILRVMLLVWFTSNLHLTWRDERNVTRKRFYIAIFLYGFVYYLYLPVTLIMATKLDSWMQKKAVVVTDILILLLAYTVFLRNNFRFLGFVHFYFSFSLFAHFFLFLPLHALTFFVFFKVMWLLFGLCGRYYRGRSSDDDDAPTLGGKRSSEDIPFEDIPKLAPAVVGSAAHAEDSDNQRRRRSEEHEGDEGEEEDY